MSWAEYEWKDGLPARALQKIEDLERQRDRLTKECQQRQFQLESLQQVPRPVGPYQLTLIINSGLESL